MRRSSNGGIPGQPAEPSALTPSGLALADRDLDNGEWMTDATVRPDDRDGDTAAVSTLSPHEAKPTTTARSTSATRNELSSTAWPSTGPRSGGWATSTPAPTTSYSPPPGGCRCTGTGPTCWCRQDQTKRSPGAAYCPTSSFLSTGPAVLYAFGRRVDLRRRPTTSISSLASASFDQRTPGPAP